jgi:hypothetical protein
MKPNPLAPSLRGKGGKKTIFPLFSLPGRGGTDFGVNQNQGEFKRELAMNY